MKRAIVTKWIGQTETKPTRIKAKCCNLPVTITVSRDEYEEVEDAHRAAAQKLADRCNWAEPMVMNWLGNGEYVHCFLERHQVIIERLEYEVLKVRAL